MTIWWVILTLNFVYGQDLSQWDYAILEKANTAKSAGYLTTSEKMIIQLMNLARMDGAKFYNTIAKDYLDGETSSPYTRSLVADLKKSTPKSPLSPKKDLFEIAQKHAIEMGRKGAVGHEKFQERTKHVQKKYKGLGENCDYGFDDPLKIVMRLLIDEGVSSKGHRKAILDERFVNIGVSIQPHKKWKYNCVQAFGGETF